VPPLPVVSGDQAAKAFERHGYRYIHMRGSHMIYVKPGAIKLSIPRDKELDRGLLRKLISDAGLDVERFVALLKKR
jgi:predicted RNA binding protein YcfA (HicA-like mRNA interferase family)